MYGILEKKNVALASYHLEDKAQLWFQLHKKENLLIKWMDLEQEIFARYRTFEFEYQFEELSKFRQSDSV